jgi:hypothetical protein
MPIKENHTSVHRDVHALFWDAKMPSVSLATGETVEKSRGRLEFRRLTTMSWTDDWAMCTSMATSIDPDSGRSIASNAK